MAGSVARLWGNTRRVGGCGVGLDAFSDYVRGWCCVVCGAVYGVVVVIRCVGFGRRV